MCHQFSIHKIKSTIRMYDAMTLNLMLLYDKMTNIIMFTDLLTIFDCRVEIDRHNLY
jgi:hypothetical protein